MANNVRCAGDGSPRRKVVAPAPCGWKGERDPHQQRIGPGLHTNLPTIRPCPQCGGRVELIEQASA